MMLREIGKYATMYIHITYQRPVAKTTSVGQGRPLNVLLAINKLLSQLAYASLSNISIQTTNDTTNSSPPSNCQSYNQNCHSKSSSVCAAASVILSTKAVT